MCQYDPIEEARRVILRHEIGNPDTTVNLIELLREVADAADAKAEAEVKADGVIDDNVETLRAELEDKIEEHNAMLATLREVDVTDREMPAACIQQVLAEYTDW